MVCVVCCSAVLEVCGSDVDDIALFGGTDLPLALVRRILEFGPSASDVEVRDRSAPWNDFVSLCFRIINIILSMRHSRLLKNDIELHKKTFEVLRLYGNRFPLVASIFTEIVSVDEESEGKAIICASANFRTVIGDAIANCESAGNEFRIVVGKLSALVVH
jgi:hypothetical protein